ncbi:MAG: ABC transporter permease [Oscillospiraceae bacterium]|jgi:ribose transport system permease protein|nr:ABC transporter permease [Oscillospiraceae bacterium]
MKEPRREKVLRRGSMQSNNIRWHMNNKLIRKLITLSLVIILAAIFGATTKSFYTLRNIQMLLREAAFVGLISLGVSFVVIGGAIDLSSGGIICFAGIVCARLAKLGTPAAVIILGAVLAGAVCGSLNGLCITKLKINDFITTLASGYIFSGLTLFLMFRDARGRIESPQIKNADFTFFGGHISGFYFISIAWLALAAVVWFVQTKTRFGLHTTAIGSSQKSAAMSGVPVDRLKLLSFVISGAFCGLAAAFTVAYQGTTYVNLGSGMGFQAVAACVIGGVVLGGGKGDAVGAVLGSVFLVLILNGIYKYGLSTAWQYFIQGAIILLAIFFDAVFGAIAAKRLEIKSQLDETGTKSREAGGHSNA